MIRFRRNFGQTAAMSAGIEAARGEVIVPMDGDLQNDPADIARAARASSTRGLRRRLRLAEGPQGPRVRPQAAQPHRQPAHLAPSPASRLHDYGCSLKAYRRDVLQGVKLYGEMHRFIPIYASWQGARVTEMVVNHRAAARRQVEVRPRRAPSRCVLDLMVVKFLASYATKPIYVFGGFGLVSLRLRGRRVRLRRCTYKLAGLKDFVQTPLPLARRDVHPGRRAQRS